MIEWKAREEDTVEHMRAVKKAIRHEKENYPEIKSLRMYRKMFGSYGGLLGGRTLGIVEIMEFEDMRSYEKWVMERKDDREFDEANADIKKTMLEDSYRIHLLGDLLRESWTER